MKEIQVFAPATVANFIVGFDSLGFALETVADDKLGDIVSIEAAASNSVRVSGKYAAKLPTNINDNIVTKCIEHFHSNLTKPVQTFALCLEKQLPVCSGLGSSAASIVATLVALNEFYGKPFKQHELLLMAGEMEAVISGSVHYDNVAPSLLGGVQLMLPDKLSVTLPWPYPNCFIVVFHLAVEIATQMARDILPAAYSLADVTEYWQRLAGFVHSLHTEELDLTTLMLEDNLLEAHRAKLIPKFAAGKKAALQSGALNFGVSGSGPTCFALVDSLATAKKVDAAVANAMTLNFSNICRVATQGAWS